MEGTKLAPGLAFFAAFYMASMAVVFASDPTQLQNFCVATNNPKNALFVNGVFCKNPAKVKADDFYFKGINVHKGVGSGFINVNITQVNAGNLPGINTLGVSMARADFGPGGLGPPHFHQRATEIVTVLEGTLNVGLVASDQYERRNRLFEKVLYPGDVFVFPQGLIHYQYNAGRENVAMITAFNSQNPGFTAVESSVVGPKSLIPADILAKAFHLDQKIDCEEEFCMENN